MTTPQTDSTEKEMALDALNKRWQGLNYDDYSLIHDVLSQPGPDVVTVEEFCQIKVCDVGSPYHMQAVGLAELIKLKHPHGLIIKPEKGEK